MRSPKTEIGWWWVINQKRVFKASKLRKLLKGLVCIEREREREGLILKAKKWVLIFNTSIKY